MKRLYALFLPYARHATAKQTSTTGPSAQTGYTVGYMKTNWRFNKSEPEPKQSRKNTEYVQFAASLKYLIPAYETFFLS
jgi:hypothetical protein